MLSNSYIFTQDQQSGQMLYAHSLDIIEMKDGLDQIMFLKKCGLIRYYTGGQGLQVYA